VRLSVVGGNLTRSTGPLIIDVTVVGTVKRRQALTRHGARPGDELYVSGTIGGAAAGLCLLRQSDGPAASAGSAGVERYLHPEPRLRLGMQLARNRAASACMDLSDGLSDAVHRIAEASGVGAIIEAGALPLEPGSSAVFESRGLDPLKEAIVGGDDYELLVAVRPTMRSRFSAAARHDVPVTRVGVCTVNRSVVLRRDGQETSLPQGGYAHFGA
jgi:thiamine-monophosphate kinase